MLFISGLAQSVRSKVPDLLEFAQSHPTELAAGLVEYRKQHGHNPSFERLHLFLQPTFQKLGVSQSWCHWVWLDSVSLNGDLLSMLVDSTGNCQVVFMALAAELQWCQFLIFCDAKGRINVNCKTKNMFFCCCVMRLLPQHLMQCSDWLIELHKNCVV